MKNQDLLNRINTNPDVMVGKPVIVISHSNKWGLILIKPQKY